MSVPLRRNIILVSASQVISPRGEALENLALLYWRIKILINFNDYLNLYALAMNAMHMCSAIII